MLADLARLLGASLPAGWEPRVRIVSKPFALVVHARDPDGGWHLFEAHPLSSERPPALAGKLLGLSYHDPSTLEHSTRLGILRSFLAHEAAIAHAIHRSRLRVRDKDERTLFAQEYWLLAAAMVAGPERAVRRLLGDAGGDPVRVHLYLQNPCAQACEFCQAPAITQQPVERAKAAVARGLSRAGRDLVTVGLANALFGALRERGGRLTLTGRDWAMHGARDRLIALADAYALPLRFMGPGTALTDVELVRRLAAVPTLEGVDVTLQSVDPDAHDRMVGAPGAFAALQEGIRLMRAHGIEPGVNTVLTREAVRGLPELVRHAAHECLPLSLLAVVREPGPRPMVHVIPPVDEVRRALLACEETLLHAQCTLDRLPLCAVPPALRHLAGNAWSFRGRAEPAPCKGCRLRSRCPGVQVAYVDLHGEASLRPEG